MHYMPSLLDGWGYSSEINKALCPHSFYILEKEQDKNKTSKCRVEPTYIRRFDVGCDSSYGERESRMREMEHDGGS